MLFSKLRALFSSKPDTKPNIPSAASHLIKVTQSTLKPIVHEKIAQRGIHADLNDLDVSEVEDMSRLFANTDFQGDISRWDVSNVRVMPEMFSHSSFQGDISGWNVANVLDMTEMFRGSKFNGDLSKWDTKSLVYTNGMFQESKFQGDLSTWDTTSLEGANGMFAHCPFHGELSSWRFPKFCSMTGIFQYSGYTSSLDAWVLTSTFKGKEFFINHQHPSSEAMVLLGQYPESWLLASDYAAYDISLDERSEVFQQRVAQMKSLLQIGVPHDELIAACCGSSNKKPIVLDKELKQPLFFS